MDAAKIAAYRQRLAAELKTDGDLRPAQRDLLLDGACELLSIADSLQRIAQTLEDRISVSLNG